MHAAPAQTQSIVRYQAAAGGKRVGWHKSVLTGCKAGRGRAARRQPLALQRPGSGARLHIRDRHAAEVLQCNDTGSAESFG